MFFCTIMSQATQHFFISKTSLETTTVMFQVPSIQRYFPEVCVQVFKCFGSAVFLMNKTEHPNSSPSSKMFWKSIESFWTKACFNSQWGEIALHYI